MKTSEFKKRLQELGFYYVDYRTVTKVHSKDTKQTTHASISRDLSNIVEINTPNIDVAKICIEYAETPISEREEEKRYIVIIPDPESFSEERVYVLVRAFNGSVMIGRPQEKRIYENEAYHLTESEIKKNHAYLWQFKKEVME